MKKSLLFFGFFFIYLIQSFGQCVGSLYFRDNDNDTFGTENFSSTDTHRVEIDFMTAGNGNTVYIGNVAFGCSRPTGYASRPHDCDDNNSNVWTTATWYTDEDGDGAYGTRHSGCQTPPSDSRPNRNDCDDDDASVQSARTYYQDIDGDGAGGASVQACHQGSYVTSGGDCDDTDENVQSGSRWYLDSDGDGVGGSTSQVACTSPGSSYVSTGGDECDDDSTKKRKNIWYFDYDNDGYGDSETTMYTCDQPDNYVDNGDDLDDANPNITDVAG